MGKAHTVYEYVCPKKIKINDTNEQNKMPVLCKHYGQEHRKNMKLNHTHVSE